MVIAIQKLKLGKNIEAKLLMIRLESDTERYALICLMKTEYIFSRNCMSLWKRVEKIADIILAK